MNRIYLIWIVLFFAGVIPVLSANGADESRTEPVPAYNDGEALPPPGSEGENWQKPMEKELRKELNDLQFKVTQQDGTEPAFRNDFWNNHEEGLYVDIVSGEPLFSSTDKYDSGTGWPSFTRPLSEGNIVEISDSSLGMVRTEVRSFYGDSHLGHVFADGPEPTGLRYCINSASLKFIPLENLREEGYGEYLSLFRKELAIRGELPDWRGDYGESETESAVFAGGCFWGVEAVYEQLRGVLQVDSGYSGGEADTAFYSSVGTGKTGHAESVKIIYDPKQIDFTTLLEVFFTVAHDPTQLNYQGPDRGTQYRSAVFYGNGRQKRLTEEYIEELALSSLYEDEIVTEVAPLKAFYPAEEYHQDFLRRNPSHPYIAYWDIPKLEDLNNRYPELIARDRM